MEPISPITWRSYFCPFYKTQGYTAYMRHSLDLSTRLSKSKGPAQNIKLRRRKAWMTNTRVKRNMGRHNKKGKVTKIMSGILPFRVITYNIYYQIKSYIVAAIYYIYS